MMLRTIEKSIVTFPLAAALALGLIPTAYAESNNYNTYRSDVQHLRSGTELLAAKGTLGGSASCLEDGVCNLGACDNDPDCPEGVAESANTNSSSSNSKGSKGDLRLRVQFNITKAAGPDANSQKQAVLKIQNWITEAERIYARAPRLKIVPYYKYETKNVPTTFRSQEKAVDFMKKHYDNIVGKKKGQGKMVIAVTNSAIRFTNKPGDPSDNEQAGGFAYFPDSIRPFGRKHGIVLNINKADASFAHELGHVFGLIHTNENDGGVLNRNCNKDFRQGENATTRVGNRVNLMDGQGLENGDEVWLNECQKDKAADHRKRLLTSDGKTNYKKL